MEAKFGHFVDLETVVSFKDFFSSLGSNNLTAESLANYSSDFRSNYLLNTSLKSLESVNTIVLLGTNPRLEAPLLNSRLRKNFIKNPSFLAFSFGNALDYLTFPVINLGNSSLSFKLFLEVELHFHVHFFLITF